MTEISLAGQVAIVTGAGNGLGRTHALELARRGAAVIVNDIAADAADGVVAEIESDGGRAAAVYESVGTPDGAERIVQATVDAFGTVDAVIHNAGAWRNCPIEEMTPENLDPVLDVHLLGAFYLVRPAWPILRDKGYGRIVLTSSATGAFGRELGSNYAASKAGLLGLGRVLALEGEKSGILVNCILPMAETSATRRPMSPEYRARLDAGLTAMRGRRTPESVSPLVALLASPACPVTGEAFSAAAGRFARVFIGVTDGWTHPPLTPASAESILEHWDEVEDRSNFVVPGSVFDEFDAIAASLRAASAETVPEPA